MKKQFIAFALIAAVAGGAMSVGAAGPGPGFGFENGECGKGGGKKGFARMAKELKLTDDQKNQIKAIMEAERERVEPLREKMAENRKALHQLAEAETVDEAAVKSLAATEANLRAEMMISHIKVRKQIDAILTAEQREQAKKMRPMHGRNRHMEGPGF